MSTLTPRSAASLAASPSIDELDSIPLHRGPMCVVTGATGFIARALIALLINKGFRVRGTVRSLSEEAEKVRELHSQFPALECFQADLLKPGSFIPALHDAEYVFHTAFPLNQAVDHPQSQLVDPALNGTVQVIESALSVETVKKIVLTSSCAAARRPELGPSHVVTEKDWNDGATLETAAFAYSKVLAERKAWELVDAHNAAATGQRPPRDVWSPSSQPRSWVIGPTGQCADGRAYSVNVVKSTWLNGSQLEKGVDVFRTCRSTTVDVRDVAKAHMAAIERPMINGRYIVSLPDVTSPLEMIAILKKHFPSRTFPSKAQTSSGVTVGRVDNSRATRELGVHFTTLEQSLKDTVERMVELGMISAA